MTALFKRKIEEADQFKAKSDSSSASDPDIVLDSTGSTGIYKVSDTEIAAVLSNEDIFNIKKGEIIFKDGGATAGTSLGLFISGGALVFRSATGYTQLAPT